MDAVPHVDCGLWIGVEQANRLLYRFRMRFGILDLIGADQHVHQGFEPRQRQSSDRPRPVLAGDQSGGDPVVLERLTTSTTPG